MVSVGSNISKTIGSGLNRIAKSKLVAKTLEYGFKNPEQFANAMLVTSIVSKDAVGCYYYTSQSLHNERIPEEKRKFVASLDLMNGIIMVGGQVLAAKVFEGLVKDHLFDKLIAKKLDNDILKEHATKLIKEAKKAGNNFDFEVVSEKLIKEYGSESKSFKAMRGGFGLLVGFLATAALTKRVIAPFLSTPLAGWYKNKFMDKKKKTPEPGRIYYEWASLEPKYNNKMDKTAFSNFNKQQ